MNNYSPGKGFFSGSTNVLRIQCSGHSGFSVKGSDIVCSAVSALVQTLVLSISRVLKIKQNLEQRYGYLDSTILIHEIDELKKENLKILIDSFMLGIFEIRNQYPDKIEIEFVTD